MQQTSSRGFTIIEVVMFLAISGALAVGLMVGMGAAIQQQQYRDAVQSFAGFLRGQYAQVISVENERPHTDSCPIKDIGDASARGRSNCLIIGRYVATSEKTNSVDGRQYDTRSVYAAQVGGAWRYGLSDKQSEYEVGWGARSRFADQGEDAPSAILMYRDPDTGAVIIRTSSGRYTSDTIGNFFQNKTEQGDMINDQFASRELCVYENGWLVGQRQSVMLSGHAGSADAITLINASEACKRNG